MAVTNDIGRVTPIWRGSYAAGTAYERNDIVIDAEGSVWWHVSEEITTGKAPGEGTIWAAVIDMSVFAEEIRTAIETAQEAVAAAEAAGETVAADAERAETAAENAETYAGAASASAAEAGAQAQAAAGSATEAAGSATEAGSSATAAAGSATEAAGSATAAAGSATAAAGSATAAAAEAAAAQAVAESIPEDYSELSEKVTDLKEQLADYNAVDLIKGLWPQKTSTSHGVTFTWDGNYCVITGGSEANTEGVGYIMIPNHTNLPESIIPGETYYLHYRTTDSNVKLLITYRGPTLPDGAILKTYTSDARILVPDGTETWFVRLYIYAGNAVAENTVVSGIALCSALSNADLLDKITDISPMSAGEIAALGTLLDMPMNRTMTVTTTRLLELISTVSTDDEYPALSGSYYWLVQSYSYAGYKLFDVSRTSGTEHYRATTAVSHADTLTWYDRSWERLDERITANDRSINTNSVNLFKYNTIDLVAGKLDTTTKTVAKVKYSWLGDAYLVRNNDISTPTQSAGVYPLIALETIPNYITPGETYYVYCKREKYIENEDPEIDGWDKVSIQIIYTYDDGTPTTHKYISKDGYTKIQVPSNATKWKFSLYVDSDRIVSCKIDTALLSALPNSALENPTTVLSSSEVNSLTSIFDVPKGCYFTASGAKIKAIDSTQPSTLDLVDNNSYQVFVYSYGSLYISVEIKSVVDGLLYLGRTNTNYPTIVQWKKQEAKNNITNQYENTYNITCNPTITTDTNNYLASPGDTTDMTGAIQAMLTNNLVCHLGPGTFYVTGVEIPNYGMLIGSGPRTRIILADTITAGYAIKMNSYSSVKDLSVWGDPTGTNFIVSADIGTRDGILFQGTAVDFDSPGSTHKFCSMIDSVHIRYFHGGGIKGLDTGGAPWGNLLISNVGIYKCDAGIYMKRFTEFHQYTNVVSTNNYYGCICNGGNNLFANCNFSTNKIGLRFEGGYSDSTIINDAHGYVCNTKFAHNVDRAIELIGLKNYEEFSNCSIGSGGIRIENCYSQGANFIGCHATATASLNISNSKFVLFDELMVRGSMTSVTIDNLSKVRFINCFDIYTGNLIDPMKNGILIASSTLNSDKIFEIKVDDNGIISAVEVT